MEFITDISVLVENGGEKSQHHFEKEHVKITRATKLWIENISGKESNFFETVKLWYSLDKSQGSTSYYTISTSEMTPVERSRNYFVTKINEEDQAITFDWIGY